MAAPHAHGLGRLGGAAARRQGDRDPLRLGRRGQDHHRRGRRRRWPPSTTAARCSCSPSTRPSGWPTRSASRQFGNVETQVPRQAFLDAGVEPRGELWAAMLDTKQSWDDLVRRHAPDPTHPRRHPRQPALQEHHRPVRAEPRLHRDGAALRDPRVGPLRPDRRRHPAHPERHRLPRGARAHGRLLLQPPAALAHRARPQPRVCRWPRSPSTPWPTASSARSSSRTSPSSSCCSRRCTRASSSGPRPWPARSPTTARPSWSSPRSSRRRSARPSSSSTPSTSAGSTSARSCSTRCCRRGSSTRAPRPSAKALCADADAAGRRCCPTTSGSPEQVARVLHEVGESFLNFQVVAKREAEMRAELSAAPEVVAVGALLRPRHHRPGRPAAAGRADLAVSTRAVVASGHPATTAAAGEVLAAGGNAFDACVAAGLRGGRGRARPDRPRPAGASSWPARRRARRSCSTSSSTPPDAGCDQRARARPARLRGGRRPLPGRRPGVPRRPRARWPCPAAWPAGSTSTAASVGCRSRTWSRRLAAWPTRASC